MKIKDISVRTAKNHVETEISFDASDFKQGCYLCQTVHLSSDKEMIACQMTAGISSLKVLTCADALPALLSTKDNKNPYNLITEIFDEKDVLLFKRTDVFEFSLPEHKLPDKNKSEKKSFIKKVFGK